MALPLQFYFLQVGITCNQSCAFHHTISMSVFVSTLFEAPCPFLFFFFFFSFPLQFLTPTAVPHSQRKFPSCFFFFSSFPPHFSSYYFSSFPSFYRTYNFPSFILCIALDAVSSRFTHYFCVYHVKLCLVFDHLWSMQVCVRAERSKEL